MITDYGFNLTATRLISINREDRSKVNEIFSSVMIIKTILLIISFVLLSLIVFSFEKFYQYREVYYVTFGLVIGQVLFPVWLFQGMERMKCITYLNVGTKTFLTVGVFIFINKQDDYLLVPSLTSIGYIISGAISLILAKKQFGINFKWQTFNTLKIQLVDGWYVFFSSLSISLYTISTTFILGLFTNNIVVGYFATAEKIVKAVRGLYGPISQAIYPLISKKINENKQIGLMFIRKVTFVIGSGMFIISAIIFIFAEKIVGILLGDQYHKSIILLQIMAFLPFVISLSNIFGIQTMINLDYKKEFSIFVLITALFGVGLSILLIQCMRRLALLWLCYSSKF